MLKKRIRALRGTKLLIILKAISVDLSSWKHISPICSVQVKFEDKVTPKYLKCPMPSTSLSNTETDIAVAARNSRPLPISMDLGLLYVGCKRVSIQPHSYSRQIIHYEHSRDLLC